jgi:hypothetical protein
LGALEALPPGRWLSCPRMVPGWNFIAESTFALSLETARCGSSLG